MSQIKILGTAFILLLVTCSPKATNQGEGGQNVEINKIVPFIMQRKNIRYAKDDGIELDKYGNFKKDIYVGDIPCNEGVVITYSIKDLNDKNPLKNNVTESTGEIAIKTNQNEDIKIKVECISGDGDKWKKSYLPKFQIKDGEIIITVEGEPQLGRHATFEIIIKPTTGKPAIENFILGT